MRNTIKNRIALSKEQKELIWENATFVFDTNVLLDFYRLPIETRDGLFKAIESIGNRIWLPKQVVLEYSDRRYDEIEEHNERLRSTKNDLEKKIKGSKLLKNEKEELTAVISKWFEENEKMKKDAIDSNEDIVLNSLLRLFDGRVGKGLPQEVIEKIDSEGEDRYSKRIPPGYKDADKNNNKYGDLIIWKEIISYSKENNSDIVFVTRDTKEDWWFSKSGKIIGPRIELREEFYNMTGNIIHFYTTEMFVELANKKYRLSIDENMIDDISDIEKNATTNYVSSLDSLINVYKQMSENITIGLLPIKGTIERIEEDTKALQPYVDSINELESIIQFNN